MKTEQVGLRIDKKLKDRLIRLTKARADGVVLNVSQVLNAALELGLDGLERQLVGKPGVRARYSKPAQVSKAKAKKT